MKNGGSGWSLGYRPGDRHHRGLFPRSFVVPEASAEKPMTPVAERQEEREEVEPPDDGKEAWTGVPPPWVAKFSKSKNKFYYFNQITKESIWTKPVARLEDSRPTSPWGGPATPAGTPGASFCEDGGAETCADLPKPWISKWSRSRNTFFFYNEETGASSWTRPRSVPPTVPEESAPAEGVSASAVQQA
mmetsp:Transcript_112074/g.302426  ORF Transcript_112074/g.302426 Transcript_112074/m.302426 type:complete len:189 (+) Transcript_112074:1-567(+)